MTAFIFWSNYSENLRYIQCHRSATKNSNFLLKPVLLCYKKSHNLAMVLRTGWTGEWSSANWRNRSKTTALRLNYDWKWMIPEKNDAIECLWKEVFDNKNDADDGDNSNWWMQGGIQARCHWVSLMLFLMMMMMVMMIDYLMNARDSVRARCHWVWHRIEKLLRPSAFSEATWRKNISNFCLSWSMMSTRRDHVMKS